MLLVPEAKAIVTVASQRNMRRILSYRREITWLGRNLEKGSKRAFRSI